MSFENLKQLLGEPTKSFRTGDHHWAHIDLKTKDEALAIEPKLSVRSVYAYPQKVEGGQKYDLCFVKETVKTIDEALVDFVNKNPGCSLRVINFALQKHYPAAHFETYLEVHGPKLVSRVRILVPKTEPEGSQSLVTLYFPFGSMLGLS